MNWKDEQVQNSIREMQKNHIECELMNYYYHLYLRDKYEAMANELKTEYDNELDCPRTGGSVIKMGDKNNKVKSPWQIDLGHRIDCLNLKKELEEQHLNQVDKWINGIKLTDDQYKVLKRYVMVNHCEHAQEVANDTSFTVENVRKIRERTIGKIYFEFFRTKCTVCDGQNVLL